MRHIYVLIGVFILLIATSFLTRSFSKPDKNKQKYYLEQARCNYFLLNAIPVDPLHEVEYFNCREYWSNQVDSLNKLYYGQ